MDEGKGNSSPLAMLVIEGPLRGFGDARAQTVGQGLIDMVERGL
jgi:hypothetical protein